VAGAPPNLWETLQATVANVVRIARAPDKSAWFICLAIFCWFMGYNAIETFWTSYGKGVIYAAQIASHALTEEQAVARSASMLTYLSAAFLVFALPAGLVATRFGRKPTILVGLGLLTVLWAGMRLTHNNIYVLVTLVLSGIGWALININSLPIVADLAPEGQLGSYTGLYYFFSMLAASLSPTLVGWLMDLLGLQVMFIFTPAFMVLAFLCMLAVRRSEPSQAASVGLTLGGADADLQ
jgi:maltose/moltooligosaccharide transporter